MTILSKRTLTRVGRACRAKYGIRPRLLMPNGRVDGEGWDPLSRVVRIARARADALQESVQWGEPYVFSVGPGLWDWVVPLVDGHVVHGGLIGGESLADGAPDAAVESVSYLVSCGLAREEAERYVAGLVTMSQARIRDVAFYAQKVFYGVSGWRPLLLEQRRERAVQQRRVAEVIREGRKTGQVESYPIEKERILLSMIKAGDRNGARRVLNDMLGAMFLYSPRLVVLRARAIELMGYLTRAAIEDSPLMEPLLERNLKWMERLIEAQDFETLCQLLSRALDEFMEGIYLQGYNRSSLNAAKVLDYIAGHYKSGITLARLAEHVGLSRFRVSHLVKEATGRSVLQIVQMVRIQNAQKLLDTTGMSCTEVAYEVGYNDQSYFTKHFKRHTGTTPSRYRRRHGIVWPAPVQEKRVDFAGTR